MMFAERYYSIHRIMLTILGLWPYQRPNILRLQAVFFFGVYFSFILFQLTVFATTTCDIDCLIKRFSYICIAIVYILNYYSFYFNTGAVKQSFEHMQLDWKMLDNDKTNNNAIKILEEYVSEAYVLTMFILVIIGSSVLFHIVYECIPVLLDVLLPLNQSRLRKTEVSFEFFLDNQQYFFLYVLQESIGLMTGVSSLVMTGTYLLFVAKHGCAMYRVASNLMQGTVTEYVLRIPDPQRTYFMYSNIRHSVHIHRRNMKLVFLTQATAFVLHLSFLNCAQLISVRNIFHLSNMFINNIVFTFQLWYLPLIIIGVVSLSFVLVRLSNAVNRINDYYEFFIAFMIFYVHLLYMFMANVYVQSVIDHSAEMLNTTYTTLWYLAPVRIQKLLLFIHTSVKDHRLKVAGFFVPSIEGFSTLITTAISYFTVMHTMHS